MKKPKTNDYDLRAAIVKEFLSAGFERNQIRHEIPMDTASSGGRTDIVLLLNTGIFGIEIKSGKDKLDNATEQVKTMRAAFDGFCVIVDEHHRKKLADDDAKPYGTRSYGWIKACVLLYCPEAKRFNNYYGYEKYELSKMFLFEKFHRRKHNHVRALAQCLWAVEIRAALGWNTTKQRCAGIDWVQEHMSLKELRPLVVAALRGRELNKWEIAFWKRYDAENAQELEPK